MSTHAISNIAKLAAALFLCGMVFPKTSLAEPPANQPASHYRIRVESPHAQQLAEELEQAGYDILCGGAQSRLVELVVTPAQLNDLRQRQLPIDILEASQPLRDKLAQRRDDTKDFDPEYPDPAEIIEAMQAAAAAHPDICQFVDLTERYGMEPTFEGRHLYAVKISDNVSDDEDEPNMLIVSNHHAREIVTPVIALYAMTQLVEGYGLDPQITNAVDTHEIWIAPTWNPDGYAYVWDVDNMWRKNRHVFDDGIGVDQNRNYPLGWDSSCSGSNDRNSQVYKGESPASEPETQTMLAWSDDRRFAKVLDYHSYGRESLWGYRCLDHPLDSYWEEKAYDLSVASGYGGRSRGPSAAGEHYQTQFGQYASLSSLVETHEEFQPTYDSALIEAATVWPGILWMLDRPIPLRGHITDAQTGEPLSAPINVRGLAFTNGEENTSGTGSGLYHAFLPEGVWDIEFTQDEYVTQQWVVEVVGGQSTTLEITLEPALFEFSFPAGAPTQLEPRGSLVLVEIVEFVEGGYVPGSAEVRVLVNGGEIAAPLVSVGPLEFVAIFPPLPCNSRVSFYFAGRNANDIEIMEPFTAPQIAFSAIVATEANTILADTFETDLGWTVENLGASDGVWVRGTPIIDNDSPYDPELDADGSGQCYLTANRFGDSDVDGGAVQLTSPAFDLSSGSGEIRYFNFLRLVRPDDGDGVFVEVSPDGTPGSWVLFHTFDSDQGPGWTEHVITTKDLIEAGVPLTDSVQFRMTANDGTADSTLEAGLDGVLIQTFLCSPQPWLEVDPLIAGGSANFTVQGNPNTRNYLAFSLAGYGQTPVGPLGITLDLVDPRQLNNMVVSDDMGVATWRIPVPAREGLEVWFQVAQPGEVSNVVVRTIQ